MNMKDLFSHLLPKRLIAPGTYTTSAGAQAQETVIDLLGFKSALIVIDTGVGGITFDGTNWSNVTIQGVLGLTDATLTNGIVRQFNAAKAAATLDNIGYTGGQRFIRLVPLFNGTHATGTFVSAYAILGNAAYQPVDALIAVTN